MRIWMGGVWVAVVVGLVCGVGGSCSREREVVVYTTLEERVAKSMVGLFEARNTVKVRLVFDAAKPSVVADRLAEEVERPVADVFWGVDSFATIRLANKGALAAYVPPTSGEIPERFRDAGGQWVGQGYRYRVLVRSTRDEFRTLLKDVKSLEDLTAPALKDRVAMAEINSPEVGSWLGALYVVWGEEKYRAWLLGLRANQVRILKSKSAVLAAVASGAAAIGLADSDGVRDTMRLGSAVTMVFPDQGPGEIGMLVMPMTLSVVAKAPQGETAKLLVDFLSQKQIEESLVRSEFLMGSLRDPLPPEVRVMEVDMERAVAKTRIATEIALTVMQDKLK